MQDRSQFLLKQSLLLAFALVILCSFFSIGGRLDLKLIAPFVDLIGHFPLKNHWALAQLNHRYVKNILILVYLSFLLGWLASFKFQAWQTRRWEFGYYFGMVVISTVLIGILKSQSAHACPWNMAIAGPQGMSWNFSATAGHCFPGGHASSGFALMAGYFVYRGSNRPRAYFLLFSASILGLAMGWAQMMRGAHFFSHNLWTGWIIWCLNVIAYALFYHKLPQARRYSSVKSGNLT